MEEECLPSRTQHVFGRYQGNEASSEYVERKTTVTKTHHKKINIRMMIDQLFPDENESNKERLLLSILEDPSHCQYLYQKTQRNYTEERENQYVNTLEAFEQMNNEIAALCYIQTAGLCHPNIVRLIDYEIDVDFVSVKMQGLDVDLVKYVTDHGRISGKKWLEIAGGLASGVKALHKLGVIHRDIQPANIMLDSDGTAVLIDFGLAKQVQVTAALPPEKTLRCEVGEDEENTRPPHWITEDCECDNDIFAMCLTLSEIYVATFYPAFRQMCLDKCKKVVHDCIQIWCDYCRQAIAQETDNATKDAFTTLCDYLSSREKENEKKLFALLVGDKHTKMQGCYVERCTGRVDDRQSSDESWYDSNTDNDDDDDSESDDNDSRVYTR